MDGDYGARSDDKTFDVIDGQQRLVTISVIVLAVLKNLQIDLIRVLA